MSLRRLASPEMQPASFAFNDANTEWAQATIAKYPQGRQASAVISLLWRGQEISPAPLNSVMSPSHRSVSKF